MHILIYTYYIASDTPDICTNAFFIFSFLLLSLQNLALGVLEEQMGVTEESIHIPSSTGQSKKRKPGIQVLEETSSDVSSSDESEGDVGMVENEEESAT